MTFCPRIKFRRKTVQGCKWFEEAMFPGYLFGLFNLKRDLRMVRSSHGVTGLVHFGDKFVRISAERIEEIRSSMEGEEVYTVQEKVRKGDEVVITEGPFKGLTAQVTAKMDAKERVRLLFEFLGSQVSAEIAEENVVRSDLFSK